MDVLFVCVHNAGRSQMAAAIFNALAAGRHTAASAGTGPAPAVNPLVPPVLAELGIALPPDAAPRHLTTEMAATAGRVITMGCGVDGTCPAGMLIAEDWRLDDPAGQPVAAVRAVRDAIVLRVRALLAELDTTPV